MSVTTTALSSITAAMTYTFQFKTLINIFKPKHSTTIQNYHFFHISAHSASCKNGKKVFYGCDGAWLLNQTYYFLKDKKLDLAVLDCTTGDYEGDFRMGEHNSIPMLRVMLPSLRTFKVIDEHTEVYFSHLAPSLHAPHEETAKIADEMGAKVARDGLEFSV